jgi:hypothetical protein
MDVYRRLLRLYPKSFRSEYGDEMRRLHRDLRLHRGVRGFRLFTSTVGDVVRSAPKLRLEEGMVHHPGRTRAVVMMLVAIALAALSLFGPFMGIPAIVILILYMRSRRDDVDAATGSTGFWIALPIVGSLLLGMAAVGDLLTGDDSDWWPLVVGPMIIGMVMTVVTLVLIGVHEASIHLLHRPGLVPARVRATSAGIAAEALAVAIVAAGEDGGWVIFMTLLLTMITLATLAVYAVLLRFTRPKPAVV